MQGKEAYASMKFLQEEFWVCLRKFPKNKEEDRKYVKDRVSGYTSIVRGDAKQLTWRCRSFIISFLISLCMPSFPTSSVPGS